MCVLPPCSRSNAVMLSDRRTTSILVWSGSPPLCFSDFPLGVWRDVQLAFRRGVVEQRANHEGSRNDDPNPSALHTTKLPQYRRHNRFVWKIGLNRRPLGNGFVTS